MGSAFKTRRLYQGTYTHTQSPSASTWVITHNLGVQYCNVSVVNSSNQIIIPSSITFDSINALTIVLSIAQTGYAVINATAGYPIVAPGITWLLAISNTTAINNYGYMCDTKTTSAFTLTLPASPSVGDKVLITDCASYFSTNNLTIGRNSLKIMELAEDMTISINNASFGLVYSGTTYGWRIF